MLRVAVKRAARHMCRRAAPEISVEEPWRLLYGISRTEAFARGALDMMHRAHTWTARDSILSETRHSTSHGLTCAFLRNFSKVQGSEVRVGSIIERKGALGIFPHESYVEAVVSKLMDAHDFPSVPILAGRMLQVLKAQHTQQGRGGATIQVELRDVQSGLKSTEKLRTTEAIELVFVDDKKFTFLYSDGDSAVLMEPATFDQVSVPLSFFGDGSPLLQEGLEVTVHHFNGEPLSASLPPRVTDTVVEAEPHFKGQTATPSYKKVKLRSGLALQVPAFVVQGDEVVIQTSDLTYVTRAKGDKS